MKSNLLPFFGFVFALLGLGAAGYFWRRSSSLYTLLVEGASRRHAGHAEKEMQIANDRLNQNRETMMQMEKTVDESRARAAAFAKQFEAKEQELRHVTEKLELQKNHLMKQLDAVNARLEFTADAKNEIEQRLLQVTQKADDRYQHQISELRTANNDLREKLNQADLRAKKAEDAAQNVNLEEVRLLKRKLAQIERLYAGMKGMRELADERNQNLETAVRKLATYTIQSQPGAGSATIPTTLGPLVGGALELIGAELIDEAAVDFSGPVDAEV